MSKSLEEGDAMANDVVMKLGDRLHDSQIRLAYYLMTVNASAVTLVLGQMEKATSVPAMLLGAVVSWAGAFCLGVAVPAQQERSARGQYPIREGD